ncbi:conserved hypothetical protein [Alkaliphilus metalliredigens QYMF]|uniref:Plasmid stabilization system n=1 Tax=Alkaliphilus metalliredigens (strain QYMF) TaxID=293826 RepID=A6TJV7_ALKMQ|nr:type II toxin-antitoxin system RelE/ParE family toxin [Alkaliphilus metalliredigens]ABR46475.1 conserved hypothetical protein [Alkaliphilus metalliredigens QYMF]
MHKLRLNPMVTEDLIEIRDYITKELENPTAAVNVQTDFRYLVSGSYIVFYQADNEFVSIYNSS